MRASPPLSGTRLERRAGRHSCVRARASARRWRCHSCWTLSSLSTPRMWTLPAPTRSLPPSSSSFLLFLLFSLSHLFLLLLVLAGRRDGLRVCNTQRAREGEWAGGAVQPHGIAADTLASPQESAEWPGADACSGAPSPQHAACRAVERRPRHCLVLLQTDPQPHSG